MNKRLFRFSVLTLLLFHISAISFFGQTKNCTIGSYEYDGVEVRLRGHNWRKVELKDCKKLELSTTDSVKIRKGAATLLVKDRKGRYVPKVGYEGVWSVQQIIDGKAYSKSQRGAYNPTGDSTKSLRSYESLGVDVMTSTGDVGTIFEVGESVVVVVSNNSAKQLHLAILWREGNRDTYNFLISASSHLLAPYAVSILSPGGEPVATKGPAGFAEVFVCFSETAFTIPMLEKGISREAFLDKMKEEGLDVLSKTILLNPR